MKIKDTDDKIIEFSTFPISSKKDLDLFCGVLFAEAFAAALIKTFADPEYIKILEKFHEKK